MAAPPPGWGPHGARGGRLVQDLRDEERPVAAALGGAIVGPIAGTQPVSQVSVCGCDAHTCSRSAQIPDLGCTHRGAG